MLNQQYAVLTPVDSYIEPLLVRVLKTEKFGICCGTIKADSISSSCGKTKGDRFKLSIPYATQSLTWNVLFDSQCPEMGPDFIFNDDTFLADIDVDTLTAKVPSLVKWNPSDGDALLNVLMELVSCYKEHQIQLLQKQEQLQLEYDMLMKSTETRPEDVEIILLPLNSKPVETKFLISLSIDLSQLPNHSCKSDSAVAMLTVTYCGANWNRIIPQLCISKSLEEVLGGTTALQLPYFPRDKFLIDYVLEVKTYIAEKINSLAESLENRRTFIATMLCLHNRICIEYDAIEFTSISLLWEEPEFQYVLHIKLPLGFPRDPPTVMLQSIYHMTEHGTLYMQRIENFPYDMRWEQHHMINKLMKHIKHIVIKEFKRNSMKRYFP